ncbi:AAA family ATPase [Niallia endozanthoxylica]|uniref:AAA domain-containing protein n=1 Tax=Niallia endozanthoxylica TaxID=2036016 RepID=A0A5J5HU83_9BACI|nr:AAA family ATPase [Niallia endozanthoxylica]KAA9023917.1 AAA domain-containing protein [Niallia endozanthoxylica]
MESNKLAVWHQELDRFRSFKTTFILEGNIHDLHPYPSATREEVQWNLLGFDHYLYKYLVEKGYEIIVFYDHIDGFYNPFAEDQLQEFLHVAAVQEGRISNDGRPSYQATIDRATEMIRQARENRERSVAVILNFASRYISSPDQLSDQERHYYSRLFINSLKPKQVKSATTGQLIYQLLFFITNKVNDIPAWFYLDNPYVKTLHINKPDRSTRMRFIDSQIRFFVASDQFDNDELKKYKDKFVDLTDGFTNIELNGLKVLCKQENIPINRVAEAVSLYKYGIKENPWNEISAEKLKHAEQFITRRVKGQKPAIMQALDIVKRATTGLAGLQHSSSSNKPKGILFFAGPTGTGKTELAKTLAQLLFGDEQACIRFDMSEYQQSHSDQKLLGAPPGYVGYEAGGQLTNKIKEHPFSILLFDEIEKAHPSILDKFLQILEDGRMTDGQGETVYFSESIIIFTSNLGIYVQDEQGNRIPNVTPDLSYQEINGRVLKGIKDYFILELGRPEILNRIGNNFVVFDYIRDDIASQIIESQLNKIKENLMQTKGISIQFDDEAMEFITDKSLQNLENGGRGIGNIIEKYFINPLSRYLFDNEINESCELTVRTIKEENEVVELESEVSKDV